jgi:thiol-disulfide isomerase/thioredoxin
MARHDEGTIGERANPTGTKKVSPARNAIAVVLLVALSTVAYLEWSANRRSGAAIRKLNETVGKQEGDLLTMKEVEDLIGRKPDGPVVEENGALKATYTWKGLFRRYPLIAIYRKQTTPKLLRIWMAGGEPPAAEAEGVAEHQPNQEAARQVAEWQKPVEDEARALEDTALLERRRQLERQDRRSLQKGGQLRGQNQEETASDGRDDGATVKLQAFASGATARVGGYRPQPLRLSSDRPAELAKSQEMAAPLFGVIALGPRESTTRVIVALDEPEGQPSRLYVDANANGDLTDDPRPVWTSSESKAQDGRTHTMFRGNTSIMRTLGGAPIPARFYFYRFDKNDPKRAAFKETLFYYADYGYEGEITLGDARYKALLVDGLATGDFRGNAGSGFSGVELMIDVNGNGRFDRRGESYDVRKPFNIKGTTYEIAGLTASGGEFQVRKSDTSVAEILPPPDLSPGQKAIRFSARTTDDQEVNFPSSYAGRLVLLDFWATWCGPCIAELPHLTKAYERFHDQGFEVLGISLDQPNVGEKVASFTREKQMPWRQVYDGKYWTAEVATLYAVDSIPQAYLVDGDTGEILAAGTSLRGERLEETIAAALRKKGLLNE